MWNIDYRYIISIWKIDYIYNIYTYSSFIYIYIYIYLSQLSNFNVDDPLLMQTCFTSMIKYIYWYEMAEGKTKNLLIVKLD